ncbi:hypothetical protein PF005_g6387 [Phytophthora fragariae]|nr:hypothetical protein PF003_g33176 [Phytophthora fragariae]KAE8943286.1 hypothetical protein PF009_g6976 [Phytophthora fragariae]KAE9020012.1 hypothetical protein PF011_g5603 [Phytophthora fragariae]KAE9124704.1 hypothetical protein PF010_g5911 [Phytophthora fragariae]KAE9124959.1 hypothetical protein PF007_g6534 [Phytophthora fragariae]
MRREHHVLGDVLLLSHFGPQSRGAVNDELSVDECAADGGHPDGRVLAFGSYTHPACSTNDTGCCVFGK